MVLDLVWLRYDTASDFMRRERKGEKRLWIYVVTYFWSTEERQLWTLDTGRKRNRIRLRRYWTDTTVTRTSHMATPRYVLEGSPPVHRSPEYMSPLRSYRMSSIWFLRSDSRPRQTKKVLYGCSDQQQSSWSLATTRDPALASGSVFRRSQMGKRVPPLI
jgi:hypothetical protein